MIVGFIGFGEVASTITKILLENEVEVLTSIEDRSEKTKKLAIESGVNLVDSYENVSKISDILISVVNPADAVSIAEIYGNINKNGIFLDLNNISPETTLELANILENDRFLDGAIIGKIGSKNSVIYVSGKNTDKISILKDNGLNFEIISENIGDASSLKMLRSIYTKGVSAILFEALEAAKKLGLEDDFFKTIAITEGEDFKDRSKSRINSLSTSSKRKFQEMEEVLNFLKAIFGEDELLFNSIMSIATKKKFKDYKKKY